MRALRAMIAQWEEPGAERWSALEDLAEEVLFEAGETIHLGDRVMEHLYLLEEGVARSIFISDEGREYVWQLYFNRPGLAAEKAHLLMDDCVSYFEREPTGLRFEALEVCRCYRIAWRELEELFAGDPYWERVGRLLTQRGYADAFRRARELMGGSAASRYEALLGRYPEIFSIVKAYHVAAYLGITPQSLSRLRRKMREVTPGE
jgi:CRP-like cAMP-binding protein